MATLELKLDEPQSLNVGELHVHARGERDDGFLCIAWIVRVTVQFDGKPELVRDWHLRVY